MPDKPAVPNAQAALPTVVVTLLPAASQTPALGPTATSPLPTEITPQPTLENQPGLHVALTPDAPGSQAWQDCALAGGWVGCDPAAPKLAARLAFFIPAGPAVAVLDLEAPNGWSIPVAAASGDPRLSWSPGAENLLVALNENQAAIYAADSAPSGSLPLDPAGSPPAWQPDQTVAGPDIVHSAQGAIAQLEQGPDLRWQIVVLAAPGAEPVRMDLEGQPSDRLYHLIGFVPGTHLLLGQTYFSGNQVMMQGAQLFTFDVENGARVDLEAMAPLGWQASFAWKPGDPPGSPATLAFTDTGGPQIGLPTLTLIDFATGDLRRPLPEGVAVGELDWQPLEGNLAFAASPLGAIAPPETAATFALPAIYLLEPASGAMRALTQPPAGARDGLPTWTGDGQWLLYARFFESGVSEVHAVQPASGQDHVIAAGLTGECSSDGPGCPWGRWLAIEAK